MPFPRRQDDVLGHHDVELVTRTDFERRLNIHVALCHLHTDLAHLLAQRTGDDLRTAVVLAVAGLRLRELDTGREDRQQQTTAEDAGIVVVHLVVETSIATHVGARHVVNRD
ncbi:hypothetical protein [Acinetobacter bereziniae]|nr:hypothetical protein [Acinetobacter bereziniae]